MQSSLAQLFDGAAIERSASQVLGAISPGTTVVVVGAPGSGRTIFTSHVAERLGERAAVVTLPSAADVDAPLQALLRIASTLGADEVERALDPTVTLADRATRVLRALAQHDRVLILRVPDDAGPPSDRDPNGDWWRVLRDQIDHSSLAVVLVAPEVVARGRRVGKSHRVDLEPCRAKVEALLHEPLWGGYADAAATLGRKLGATTLAINPLQLRLMVGLVGLGAPISHVAPLAHQTQPGELAPFVRLLKDRLTDPSLSPVRRSVRRLALLRTALPVSDAMALAESPREHEALLRHCIGYGDEELKVATLVRADLLRELGPSPERDVDHERAALRHEQYDGATDPVQARRVSAGALHHWLEKVHHLAHGGRRTEQAWRAQSLESREWWIARARSLSIDHQEYEAAAAV